MRTAPLPPVTVFDPDTPGALAFVRSLGRAGVPVIVSGPGALPAARLSRYHAGFRRSPDPTDPERFIPWLEAEIDAGRITRVAPTSDLIAFYLALLRARLPPSVRAVLPSREAVEATLFKDRFDDACRGAGVATPFTLSPPSVEAAHDAAASLPYPVVLKPRSHVAVPLARGVVVEDADALRAAFQPYAVPEVWRRLLRRDDLGLPVIQAWVGAGVEDLVAVSGMLGYGGDLLARTGHVKRGQWPPRVGVGTVFEPFAGAEVLDTAVTVVRRILGRFELELVRLRDGTSLAIDLNPRAHGQIRFDVARQVDLPLIWYRATLGEITAPAEAVTGPTVFHNGIPWHVGEWVAVARGPGRRARLDAYLAARRQPHVDIVHDRSDPLPSLAFAARLLRHPGGLLRPYLA
jgi:D-aspartate ligase